MAAEIARAGLECKHLREAGIFFWLAFGYMADALNSAWLTAWLIKELILKNLFH